MRRGLPRRTNNLPAGAIKVTYDVSSVSRNASKQPVIVFRMLQNGVAVPFNTFGAGKTEIWDNFMGAPSVYFVFAVPQDGITAPADFNASASGYLRSIWNGTSSGTGKGTLTGPDANGYYTVTLTGVTIPDNAVMLTGGLGYTYSADELHAADADQSGRQLAGRSDRKGACTAPATEPVSRLACRTDRRPDRHRAGRAEGCHRLQPAAAPIVDDKRCNACHQELGAFTTDAFHAGQRNDGTTCSWCHNPNRTSSGWSADSTSFVHAIHAASKREKPFTWHAASTDGIVRERRLSGHPEQVRDLPPAGHVRLQRQRLGCRGGQSPVPLRGHRHAVSSTATDLQKFSASPYVTAGHQLWRRLQLQRRHRRDDAAADTTLVSSPTATVCFACHDGSEALAHMRANGGSIYAPRAAALATARSSAWFATLPARSRTSRRCMRNSRPHG